MKLNIDNTISYRKLKNYEAFTGCKNNIGDSGLAYIQSTVLCSSEPHNVQEQYQE